MKEAAEAEGSREWCVPTIPQEFLFHCKRPCGPVPPGLAWASKSSSEPPGQLLKDQFILHPGARTPPALCLPLGEQLWGVTVIQRIAELGGTLRVV